MITIILEVSSERDMEQKLMDASSQFSASAIKFVCRDSEFGETVDKIYWIDDVGFTHFPELLLGS